MEEWKLRLRQARLAKELSKTKFAEIIPVSKPTVTDWEKSVEDGGIQEISGPNLVRVCEVLEITPQWLYEGVAPAEATSHSVQESAAPYNVSQSKFREVPVIGKGMGGLPDARIWTDGDFPPGTSDKYGVVATSDPNAFIGRVEEGSMVPRYNPGEYFLVEPNTTPEVGEDVLVRFRSDGTSLKRLLSRRDGFITLGSYNTTATVTVEENEIVWMYYVAHPVPVRNIKNRF